MVFEREKTEKTNGDRELARTEKSLLYALSIRAATERKRNGYYLSGGSNPSPSANLENRTRTLSNSQHCNTCPLGWTGRSVASVKVDKLASVAS